jgi:hypothetical protein
MTSLDLLIIIFIKFSPLTLKCIPKIQSINSDRDGFIFCQRIKIDLAYTETKRNRL